jgi:hypothetical protein
LPRLRVVRSRGCSHQSCEAVATAPPVANAWSPLAQRAEVRRHAPRHRRAAVTRRCTPESPSCRRPGAPSPSRSAAAPSSTPEIELEPLTSMSSPRRHGACRARLFEHRHGVATPRLPEQAAWWPARSQLGSSPGPPMALASPGLTGSAAREPACCGHSLGPSTEFKIQLLFQFLDSIQTPVSFQISYKFEILSKIYEINYVRFLFH